MDKTAWRQRMLAIRSRLSAEEHQIKSRQICNRLSSFVKNTSRPLTVAAYMPFRREVDILPFIAYCWREGVLTAIPKPDPGTGQMDFFYIGSMEDLAARPGAYGIMEPRDGAEPLADDDPIDMAIIPGLAFDETMARLGYGGGYYDRWMTRYADCDAHARRPLWISPAFEWQIIQRVPAEAHDVRLDVIVTERRQILVDK